MNTSSQIRQIVISMMALLLLGSFVEAQNPEWKVYNQAVAMNKILNDGNELWVHSASGMAQYNKNSKSISYLDQSDNDFATDLFNDIYKSSLGVYWFAGGADIRCYTSSSQMVFYDTTNTPFQTDGGLRVAEFGNKDIWVSGSEFIKVYNGTTWSGFDTTDHPSIIPFGNAGYATAFALHHQSDSNIMWIGSNKGLFSYNGTTWDLLDSLGNESPQQFGQITCITDDGNGGLYLGTSLNGVYIFDGVNWTNFNSSNSTLSGNYITTLDVDGNGFAWAGTISNGLNVFIGSAWITLNVQNSSLTSNSILDVEVDGGLIWIGTASNILHSYDGFNWTQKNFSKSTIPTNWTKNVQVSGAHVWAGSNIGLMEYNMADWNTYSIGNTNLADNYIYKSCVDPSGNLWILNSNPLGAGTYKGISKLSAGSFIHFDSASSGLPTNLVSSLACDLGGNIWAGFSSPNASSIHGIAKYDGFSWTHFDNNNTLLEASDTILDMEISQNNHVMIGTANNGAYIFTGSNWTQFKKFNSPLPTNKVTAVIQDNPGNKWFGVENSGIVRFDGGNWFSYSPFEENFPFYHVTDLAVEQSGPNIWACGGLNQYVHLGAAMFDGNNWSVINTENSPLPSSNVQDITIDDSNNVWFATANGLAVFGEGGLKIPVGIEDEIRNQFDSSLLYPNFPNPFISETNIHFAMPISGEAQFEILNIQGERVFEIPASHFEQGTHTFQLSLLNEAPGIYLLRMTSGENQYIRTMIKAE